MLRGLRAAHLPRCSAELLGHDWTKIAEAGREICRFDSRPWLHELSSVPTAVIATTADDIVQHASGFYVLSTTCTHLGCTPNYLSAEGKFKCPCHGSGFRVTGINFEGPAPRPLERVRVALAEDGQILVDKSRKFQFELGQWIDPDSFLQIA